MRQIGDFARFLEVVSFSHGTVLTIRTGTRETAVHREAIEGYLDVLDNLLVAFWLPVFTKRAMRATAAHPTFYFFDTGVFRAPRLTGPLDRPAELDGVALEGFVAPNVRAWIAYSGPPPDLSHWRTRTGIEVDFVVYGNAHFFALEVKNTERVRPDDLRGLGAFMGEYP